MPVPDDGFRKLWGTDGRSAGVPFLYQNDALEQRPGSGLCGSVERKLLQVSAASGLPGENVVRGYILTLLDITQQKKETVLMEDLKRKQKNSHF